MPIAIGVHRLGERRRRRPPRGGPIPAPAEAVFLNDTFYNNGIGILTTAPEPTGTNFYSHVALLAMDDIFDGSTTAAVETTGQNYGGRPRMRARNDALIIDPSQLQYNLFFNNGG